MEKGFFSSLSVFSIRGYQKIFRPIFHVLSITFFGYYSHCKHSPTCSEYTIIQIRRHGTITGLKKGVVRIWNCR